jgi:hypothetical protein
MVPRGLLGPWITGNPHNTWPLLNQLSCTGEHVEIKVIGYESTTRNTAVGILWSWAKRPNIVPQVSIRESHWLRAVTWAGNISISHPQRVSNAARSPRFSSCANEACFLDAIFLVNERWHFSNLSYRFKLTRKWWELNINGTNSRVICGY